MIEPVLANNGLFELGQDYLSFCRKIATQNGALLIFDEVITGFRLAMGGAQEYYGVSADIGTYGKILGGGMPVGAVAAKANIMKNLAPLGRVYQAGTLSGNPLAMTAGLAHLKALKEKSFHSYTEELGKHLDSKILEIQKTKALGYRRIGSIIWFVFGSQKLPLWPNEIPTGSKENYAKAFHTLLDLGFYLAPCAYEVGFLSRAHTKQDLDRFAEALESA